MRHFRKRTRGNSIDSPNAKSMKNVRGYVKSIKSVTQTLENVSNTDKIIRNAGKLIASNPNQVIEYIESQVKSKVESKSPETSISVNLLLVQSSTGVKGTRGLDVAYVPRQFRS